MNRFSLIERCRRAKDLNEIILRDWVAINKFAEERGLKKGIIGSFTRIVKNRFPTEYSNSCDDWSAFLESKSVPELKDLINTSLNCESFQEIADRLSNV